MGAFVTVGRVLDLYLAEHVEEKVVDKGRQKAAANNLKRFFADRALTSVDIPACRDYVKRRLAGTCGDAAVEATIRRELNALAAAANHCKRWRHISAADMPDIELPSAETSKKVEWLTKAEVADVFNAEKTGKAACFARIAYYTAARRHSIERLRVDQVDLKNGCIHLSRPGEKITKKRRPTVPLYDEIRPAIAHLLERTGTEYLFGAPWSLYRPFVALCAKAEISAHPHMMRHSRATHMLQDGESIYKVAKLLGDTVSTVEKVYAHACMDFLQTGSRVGAE